MANNSNDVGKWIIGGTAVATFITAVGTLLWKSVRMIVAGDMAKILMRMETFEKTVDGVEKKMETMVNQRTADIGQLRAEMNGQATALATVIALNKQQSESLRRIEDRLMGRRRNS